ncbi:MAG: aromatic amino acid lyase [Alphaproteobacteria bacterium]
MATDTAAPVILTGNDLDLPAFAAAAERRRPVAISEDGWGRIAAAREIVEAIVADGRPAYGITTGVGSQKEAAVSAGAASEYNRRLIAAHATRVPGPLLEQATVRGALVYMANAFAKGFSGISPDLVRLIVDRINRADMPEIDASGSVGASDLVPLAQIAQWLLRQPEAEGLPRAKDALALMNSNAISLASGALRLAEADRLLAAFDLALAAALEGFRGNPSPLSPVANAAHRRRGQAESAARTRCLLAGSALWREGVPRQLQDPLSFRCASQAHGAAIDALSRAEATWVGELNSVHDNPVIDVVGRAAVSTGNMDTTAMSLAIDSLRLAIAKICDLSGERLHKQQWPAFSGLPIGLAEDESAIGGAQFLNLGHIAASLIVSAKIWARPHLTLSVGQLADGVEDTAGYALHGVHDLQRLVDAAWKIAAIELAVAVWAMRRRRLDRGALGIGVRPAYDRIGPQLPIGREGVEVFSLTPLIDALRTGGMLEACCEDAAQPV